MGATAGLLLEADEAQDIEPQKWDRDLVPMAASGAATRVLYGTPWTEDTLLGREVERNRELERRDGIRRHFEVGWEAVAGPRTYANWSVWSFRGRRRQADSV